MFDMVKRTNVFHNDTHAHLLFDLMADPSKNPLVMTNIALENGDLVRGFTH